MLDLFELDCATIACGSTLGQFGTLRIAAPLHLQLSLLFLH